MIMHIQTHQGALAFSQSLSPAERAWLTAFSTRAVEPPPVAYLPWHCGQALLGIVSPSTAQWLTSNLDHCVAEGAHLVWQSEFWTLSERSQHLQAALQRARDQGLLSGWRDELFSFWSTDCETPRLDLSPLFNVERAGFRFLGMLSHAVHINGFMTDGRLWCARRALSKATDPGMLDNITAGGLPSGESVEQCLHRELWEEAGVSSLEMHVLQTAGSVRTSRLEPQGWHDEVLHVFNLTLNDEFQAMNQDGEVDEFMCLQPKNVLARIEAGELTVDAIQTLLQGLRYAEQQGES